MSWYSGGKVPPLHDGHATLSHYHIITTIQAYLTNKSQRKSDGNALYSQQTRGIGHVLVPCWASVADDGQLLNRHMVNGPYLLGCDHPYCWAKPERQYLLTLQVRRYWILALHGRIYLSTIIRKKSGTFQDMRYNNMFLSKGHNIHQKSVVHWNNYCSEVLSSVSLCVNDPLFSQIRISSALLQYNILMIPVVYLSHGPWLVNHTKALYLYKYLARYNLIIYSI